MRTVASWMGRHKFWVSLPLLYLMAVVLGELEVASPSGCGMLLGVYLCIGCSVKFIGWVITKRRSSNAG